MMISGITKIVDPPDELKQVLIKEGIVFGEIEHIRR